MTRCIPAMTFSLLLVAPSPAKAQAEAPPPQKVEVVNFPPTPPTPPVSLDNIKGGKLVQYGFSLGASYALQIQLPVHRFRAVDTNNSFMPYLALYPGMALAQSKEVKAYCSASWTFSPPPEAKAIAEKSVAQKYGLNDDTRGKLVAETLTEQEAKAVDKMVGFAWGKQGDPTPDCKVRMIGIYVGKPSKTSAVVHQDGPEKSFGVRDMNSIISAGIVWSPNIAFSGLLGVSWWRTSNGGATGVPSDNLSVFTLTVGLGGNLDIFSALFK
jgi:hypothetical protein